MVAGSSGYEAPPREVTSLDGWWHTWFDEAADWRAELPMLPGTPLSAMPHRPPTAGWDGMEHGMESLQVPGTWEASRPGYHGVGWHWRPIAIPEDWAGRAVRLRFEAARLRTEVYLDRHLVGYDLEGGTPFEVDLTEYTRPGKRHELALRITNPGGARHADDDAPIRWAGLELPGSHDYGGLWGSVSLLSTARTYIRDLFVFPRRDLGGATVRCTLRNTGPRRAVLMGARAYDADGAQTATSPAYAVRLGSDATEVVDLPITISEPRLWAPGSPYLYRVAVWLQGDGVEDALETPFGLRTFALREGRFFLNGEPFFLCAADTANWYPGNLAFPTPQLAEQEVSAALEMGLNTLVARGQACPPALLEAADRGGLLIIQGPGGVPGAEDPGWPRTQAGAFRLALLEERVRRLARRDRGHPALVWWNVAGETGARACAEPLPPYLARLTGALREEDPTRVVSWGTGVAGACALEPGAAEAVTLYSPALPDAGGPLGDTTEGVLALEPPQGAISYARRPAARGALPDLPELVQRYGDRVLPGSDADAWQAWRDALAHDWHQYGLGRTFADLSVFCRATQALATQAASRWVEACRLHPACAGLSCGPWAPTAVPGPSGLVDIHRVPQGDATRLRRAVDLAPLAIVAMPEQARSGEPFGLAIHAAGVGDAGKDLRLELAVAGPDGVVTRTVEGLSLERRGWGPIATLEHAAEGVGAHTVTATLLRADAVLGRAEQTLWVTRLPDPGAGEVAVRGSEAGLAALDRVPGLRWRRHTGGEASPSLLVLDAGGHVDAGPFLERAAARGGRIALLIADGIGAVEGVLRALQAVVESRGEARPLALPSDWPGGWVFGHAHRLLQGVAEPGIWGPTHARLLPTLAVTGVPCNTLVGGCAFMGSQAEAMGPPRIGTVLGLLPLGPCEVLFTTLPVLEAASERLPVAERLLGNIAAWLTETS